MRTWCWVSVLMGCAAMLAACAPALVTGVAGSGVKFAAEERSAGTIIDDAALWRRINRELAHKAHKDAFTHTEVKVKEGRVLLTGWTHTPEQRMRAAEIAWNFQGVKEVMNELSVGAPASTGRALLGYSQDSWITTQLKTKLLLAKNIQSVNYTIETIRGVVYLIGIAQDQQELDRVTWLASRTRGVKKVVSYVRTKDSPLRDVNQLREW